MLRTKRTFLSSILVSPLAFSRVAAGRNAEPPQAGGGAGEIDAAKFPSLQAALDAVPEAGGVVRLPPGEFKLTRPLVLSRERTRLTGSGDATRLLNVNESGEPAILIRHPKRASETNARLWGIQLEGFRISGNPKSGDGLFIEGVNEIVLRSLTIERHGGHGIHLYDGYENPRLVQMQHDLQRKGGAQHHPLPRHRRQRQPVRGEPGRAALHRQLQPVHDRQLPRRPPAARRRHREHLRLGGLRQHDRGVRRRRPSSSTATATASR